MDEYRAVATLNSQEKMHFNLSESKNKLLRAVTRRSGTQLNAIQDDDDVSGYIKRWTQDARRYRPSPQRETRIAHSILK